MAKAEHPDVERLTALEQAASAGGGAHLQGRQKKLGRLLVRERIELLTDAGSFSELGAFQRNPVSAGEGNGANAWGDGAVVGTARIDGRPVALYAHDTTILRGSMGPAGAQKILRILDIAEEHRLPIVGIVDSDGARVSAGQEVILGVGDVLTKVARISGWVPHVSVVLGLCGGAAAYSAAMSDVVIAQTGHSYLFVTGAKVTQVVTGKDFSLEELGGAQTHAKKTGLVHLHRPEEEACLALARAVLSYLPRCGTELPPAIPSSDPVDRATPEIAEVIPESPKRAYEVRKVIAAIFDSGSFLELQADYARTLVVGFARLGGRAVGVVASQPAVYAGALDSDSARKGGRFVQLCSAYGLPVITLVDVPGFRPGVDEEHAGLLLHGAKLISAYARCLSPMITLILRKSYGGANVLTIPSDVRLAYPFARVQPMGTEAALAVVTHRTFGEVSPEELEAFRERFTAQYDAMHLAPEAGIVDRVIRPEATRTELVRVLESLDAAPRRRLPPVRQVNLPY